LVVLGWGNDPDKGKAEEGVEWRGSKERAVNCMMGGLPEFLCSSLITTGRISSFKHGLSSFLWAEVPLVGGL